MPVSVSIDKQKKLVTRIIRESISFDELARSFEATVAHPDFNSGMKILNDIRKIKHKTDTAEIRKLSALLSKHSDKMQESKSAIVVPNQVYYGMMRMLQGYSSDLPLAIRVFYDIKQAKEWLQVE